MATWALGPIVQLGSGAEGKLAVDATMDATMDSSCRSTSSNVCLAFTHALSSSQQQSSERSSGPPQLQQLQQPSLASAFSITSPVDSGVLGAPSEPSTVSLPSRSHSSQSAASSRKQTGYRKLWALVNSVKHGEKMGRACAEDVSVGAKQWVSRQCTRSRPDSCLVCCHSFWQ